jgi:TPR repeat protein
MKYIKNDYLVRKYKKVREDKKIAKEWFGKACDGGYQKGCDNYKILNQQGY